MSTVEGTMRYRRSTPTWGEARVGLSGAHRGTVARSATIGKGREAVTLWAGTTLWLARSCAWGKLGNSQTEQDLSSADLSSSLTSSQL